MYRFALALSGIGLASILIAANTPAIGVAISEGALFVNSARTPGNATLFSGAELRTTAATQVRLKDGAKVRLENDSRGKLFRDHLELEEGSARITDFVANAHGLKVLAENGSSASLSVAPQGKAIEVASLYGHVRVFNANGLTVANLLPGRALDLEPQEAGAAAPSSMVGCGVRNNAGSFFLTDETSNVTVQLRGGNIRPGRRVQITGTLVPNATATAPATQVLNVTNVREVGGACQPGAAAATAGAAGAVAGGAAGAVGGAAAAGAAGVSSAVVAGVAAAAAVGTGAGIAATSTSAGSSTGSSTAGGTGIPVANCISPCATP